MEELHCLQGFANHTFFDGLVKLLGEEKALNFAKSLNLVAKDYHGRVFEDYACHAMLKHAEKMMDRAVPGDTCPLGVISYVRSYI